MIGCEEDDRRLASFSNFVISLLEFALADHGLLESLLGSSAFSTPSYIWL